jgi:hypothetical protein
MSAKWKATSKKYPAKAHLWGPTEKIMMRVFSVSKCGIYRKTDNLIPAEDGQERCSRCMEIGNDE